MAEQKKKREKKQDMTEEQKKKTENACANEEDMTKEAAETVIEAVSDNRETQERSAFEDMFSKYARLQADFENYKKRNRETAKVMYEEGVADVVTDVLPTLDYLEMAIVSQKDESFRQGLELVKKAFLDALGKYGVEEIDALGKEFDPNVHEAAMNRDDPENAGKVVQVLKKGYIRNGKVLRHPLVVVGQ